MRLIVFEPVLHLNNRSLLYTATNARLNRWAGTMMFSNNTL
jgi:hypothetical protein